MADTIITNTPGTDVDDSAGWMVALAILLGLILAGAFIYQNGYFRTVAADTATNVTVTVPNSVTPAVSPAPTVVPAPVPPTN